MNMNMSIGFTARSMGGDFSIINDGDDGVGAYNKRSV